MKECAFFGHREYDYNFYEEKLLKMVEKLIVDCNVERFYSGGRGNFDLFSAKIVKRLQEQYPTIKMTKVFSYMPKKEEMKELLFDDTVYLLERNVPKRFAILETNKKLVDKVDFIVSGVEYGFGGAVQAIGYARTKKKQIISIFE